MLIVALCALAVAGFTVLAAFRLVRADRRENARREQVWEAERGRLIDQLLYATGKTWTPPPERVRAGNGGRPTTLTDEQAAEAEIARAW